MKHFSNIIIGFGKAGKTLAGTLAKHGEEVLVIEKDPQHVWWYVYKYCLFTN